MRSILAPDQHVARAVVGPRIEDLPGQWLIVGDGVGGHGLAQDQVATALDQFAHRRLAMDIQPLEAELHMETIRERRASSTSNPGRSSLALE